MTIHDPLLKVDDRVLLEPICRDPWSLRISLLPPDPAAPEPPVTGGAEQPVTGAADQPVTGGAEQPANEGAGA